jgi:hypothetical protein
MTTAASQAVQRTAKATPRSHVALRLALLTGFIAIITALSGILWQHEGSRFTFTTLNGQTVEIYGQGLYRNDTVFAAAAFTGTDVVTLLVAVPLLLVALRLTQRGSLRGAFLLTGALSYFLYNGASMGLGAAYNPLFLGYVALFSVSLFAFATAFGALNRPDLPALIRPGLPHRALAIFLFVAGIGTALIWLSDVVGALIAGQAPPMLGPYTTKITYTLDIGIITPLAVLSGALVLRRKPLGYAMAFPITLLCMLIGVVVVAQTITQLAFGISYNPVQFGVFIVTWVLMSLFAGWLTVVFLRHVEHAR